jgi:hypothetical protein
MREIEMANLTDRKFLHGAASLAPAKTITRKAPMDRPHVGRKARLRERGPA